MDKLKMQSENLVNENIDKIAKLFPNCITEGTNENGEIVKLVDFDLLKQELSSQIVEGTDERYTLNWAGKKQAILTANSPINATLRPYREESVDFDNTKNLYIEGDNLDVLKLLRETYLGKVKMIYIDPPYNTGNDFVYEDDFATSTEDYLQASKSYDEQGNKMFQNNDSNGRFHSDWLSMMYSRLRLAKDLLIEEGLIFISLDEKEYPNLRKICDEIFGEKNIIGNVIWKKTSGDNKSSFAYTHDNILVYGKYTNNLPLVNLNEKQVKQYKNPDNDVRGMWAESDYRCKWSRVERPNLYYGIRQPNTGEIIYPDSFSSSLRVWAFSQESHLENVKNDLIWWGEDGLSREPKKKRFLSEHKGANTRSIWDDAGTNDEASKELRIILGGDFFDNPKPIRLIKKILNSYTQKQDIIIDFFSGSATTAHAVMELNAEDGGNRKFIMVQLPENCEEKSEAYKAGYKNICEIGKERIRRAGRKILTEKLSLNRDGTKWEVLKDKDKPKLEDFSKEEIENAKMDIGFRVLKLDSSCMKDVYYDPNKMSQDLLAGLEDNIREDRTPEDLLFQVMLDMGVMLSSEIKTIDIKGKKVFNVNDGNLVCCFDNDLTDEVVTEIAKMKPLYAVFRDSSMAKDSVAVNFDQIFETYSSETVRKVL